METLYEPEHRRLTLTFGDDQELASFAEATETNGGFLVQLGTALRLHDTVELVLRTEAATARLSARVAQVFDKGFGSFGTAFLIDDPATLGRRLDDRPTREVGAPASAPASGQQTSTGESPTLEPPIEPSEPAPEAVDEGASGEMMGTSPIHRIQAMNPRQRAMLAPKAGRTERQILLRDKSPMVLEGLLNNPRIDSEEVLRIARSSRVVAPTLQRIAGDARWNGNQEILAVIARHPKTPSVLATRLMPSLRTSDLRTMAKMSSGLREMVRKAALREYMQRTGQRI